MRRYITLGLVVLVLVFGAYIALFKRGMAARMVKGYKTADPRRWPRICSRRPSRPANTNTPRITARGTNAEQLRRGNAAASEFATALDNLIYQMKERDLIRDETKVVFFRLDPFPKDITITVSKGERRHGPGHDHRRRPEKSGAAPRPPTGRRTRRSNKSS
jgi:hypothetical protein